MVPEMPPRPRPEPPQAAGLERLLAGAAGEGRQLDCEVLVVGAGPAGSSAARAAAAAGAEVILIDRRPAVGLPARCAGYVPLPLMSLAAAGQGVVGQRVERMLTHYPGGTGTIAAAGFVVHRGLFDQQLASSATAAGARLITGCRAAAREGAATVVTSSGAKHSIAAKLTIGADGPRSAVGSWVGAVNGSFAVAAQWTVGLNQRLDDIHVYFERELPGGYGWLFPLADRANVGVAVAGGAGIRPAVALRSFAARLAGEGLIELDGAVATGGLIPVGGPLACRAGDILLAGDAAGHCHPLTGAGIATAVQCGELAGRAAAESLATGSSTPLRQYEEEVEELFGEHLRQAAESRRKLYRHWDAPANDLCRALRRAWVGCSGYNRRDDG
ncbi:MAG: geranylgeranyl reductase family protein [Thermoleophilia bacterium]